jgi:hypothetical protein
MPIWTTGKRKRLDYNDIIGKKSYLDEGKDDE